MIEFALIVSLMGDFGPEQKYVASFPNCHLAEIYYDSNYRGKDTYNGYRCIRKDLLSEMEKLKLGV